MSKKILFTAYSMDIGGIETALVTLINQLAKENYNITLVLEKKQGIFLNQIDDCVRIVEYTPSECKIKVLAKIKNMIKRIRFIMKYKNKFDCSISYATYSLPGSFVARTASKNSILWVHNEYLLVYNNDIEDYKKFFCQIHANAFKKIVFVSNSMRNTFETLLGDAVKCERATIYNLIDYRAIINKSNAVVEDFKKNDKTTFLYVGRLTESDKRISRLIKAAKLLKDDKYDFRVLVVGDGKDFSMYKSMVKDNGLDNVFVFIGKKKNPYPYFRLSDCLVLPSEHEGFGIVNLEAMILEIPIITTDIADSREMIEFKYGLVTDKNEESLYKCMKSFCEDGFELKCRFDAEKYNQEILKKINELIEGEK